MQAVDIVNNIDAPTGVKQGDFALLRVLPDRLQQMRATSADISPQVDEPLAAVAPDRAQSRDDFRVAADDEVVKRRLWRLD